MIKSSSDNTAPRWKRSAVKGTLIGVRLQPDLLKALDKWAKPSGIGRPEAIRRLLEKALSA
jgi:metal-responsive CopG/Arc/MetJ family transcriptional regulator